MVSVCLSGDESDFLILEVIPVLPLLFEHTPQHMERSASVHMDALQNKYKKKRKGQREEGETGTAPTPDIHPELPEAPAPVDLDTPQKKMKKKKKTKEGETGAAKALIHSPQLPEVPAPVSGDTPGEKEKKKRKRKKMREEEGRETSPAPGQTEIRPVLPHTTPNPDHDPKLRRGREEAGGEGGSIPVEAERGGEETAALPGAVKEKKRRKKEKRRNEERGEGWNVSLGETGGEMGERETDGQTRKRKKKHTSIGTVTTDHNTTRTTEADTTTTAVGEERRGEKDKKRRRGESLEQPQLAAIQATQDGVTVIEGKKKRRTIQKEGSLRRGVEDRERLYGEEVLRELLEFIPHLPKCENSLQKMIRYDLHRFKEFRRQGIELRSGRYSVQEKQRIRENVKDFLALTGISSSTELFYPHRCTEQEDEIKTLRTKHKFYERIADGVARPCYIVYYKARKMLDTNNFRGKFTEDELQYLEKLQTRHGNDWKTISKKMDRSVYSLAKRFQHNAANHGPWKSEEVDRLMKALQAHMESQVAAEQGGSGAGGPWLYRRQLCVNLPWTEVSHQVQTRNWTQCRVKWFCILRRKMVPGQRPVLSIGPRAVRAKIDLINMLYTMNVDDEVDIDWEEVALAVGRVTYCDVQNTFRRLKITRVPMWSSLPYCDIIDFLWEKEVPRLEEVLKKSKEGQLNERQQSTGGEEQDKYFLSDIFSQEEFSEVDNAHLTADQSQN